MTRRMVEIVPLEITDEDLLRRLASEITRVLPFECRIADFRRLPDGALDTTRHQYHATRILEHLDASGQSSFRQLGVTAVDLFTPILRYVFGEAMLPGRAALVSTYRLGIAPIRDDRPRDRSVFISRVIKEGIHELGHTFGLTHCDDPSCVMTASLDMARIDAKSTQLCYYCKIMLEDELARI